MPTTPGGEKSLWAQAAVATSLGFVLFANIAGGYLLGWVLDRWLRTAPIFGLILAGLGLAAGLVEIIQVLKRVEKQAGNNTHGPSQN